MLHKIDTIKFKFFKYKNAYWVLFLFHSKCDKMKKLCFVGQGAKNINNLHPGRLPVPRPPLNAREKTFRNITRNLKTVFLVVSSAKTISRLFRNKLRETKKGIVIVFEVRYNWISYRVEGDNNSSLFVFHYSMLSTTAIIAHIDVFNKS